jgi:hypothetical protein
MSVRGDFAQSAADIFAAFGDVPVDVLLTKLVSTEYDPTTGTVESANDEYEGQGFVIEYDQHEVDGETVRTGDVKCILRQAEFTEAPTPSDRVTIAERIYEVINIGKDPADALWILQLRSPDA